jgi:hypothetical protein
VGERRNATGGPEVVVEQGTQLVMLGGEGDRDRVPERAVG